MDDKTGPGEQPCTKGEDRLRRRDAQQAREAILYAELRHEFSAVIASDRASSRSAFARIAEVLVRQWTRIRGG